MTKRPANKYGVSFWSSKGLKISEEIGPLKLAMAPFTIYRNFPLQKTGAFTINSSGFRGAEVDRQPGPRLRVMVVGGSAAFGLGVENDQETFEAMLEKSDGATEVINAGVIGFSSGQELASLVTEWVDYRPDLLIAYNGWNDLFTSWVTRRPPRPQEIGYNLQAFGELEEQLIDHHRLKTSPSKSLRRFLATLLKRSALLLEISRRVSSQGNRTGFLRGKREELSRQQQRDLAERAAQGYARNMIKMRDFCASESIRFLVVLQPEVGLKPLKSPEERSFLRENRLYEEEFPSLYQVFLDRSQEILRKNGIRCMDLNAQAEWRQEKKWLFVDWVHTNREGNQIIAHLLQRALKKETHETNRVRAGPPPVSPA